jgi:hypothetical protein
LRTPESYRFLLPGSVQLDNTPEAKEREGYHSPSLALSDGKKGTLTVIKRSQSMFRLGNRTILVKTNLTLVRRQHADLYPAMLDSFGATDNYSPIGFVYSMYEINPDEGAGTNNPSL